MRIGMATTVPTTTEQKLALLTLASTLGEAAQQAQNLGRVFGTPNSVVTVEGRDLEATLATISRQLMETMER